MEYKYIILNTQDEEYTLATEDRLQEDLEEVLGCCNRSEIIVFELGTKHKVKFTLQNKE